MYGSKARVIWGEGGNVKCSGSVWQKKMTGSTGRIESKIRVREAMRTNGISGRPTPSPRFKSFSIRY